MEIEDLEKVQGFVIDKVLYIKSAYFDYVNTIVQI